MHHEDYSHFVHTVMERLECLEAHIKYLNERVENMATLADIQVVVDAVKQATSDLETRIDALITSLQNGTVVGADAVVAELSTIKDSLTGFHAVTTSSSSTVTSSSSVVPPITPVVTDSSTTSN